MKILLIAFIMFITKGEIYDKRNYIFKGVWRKNE